VSSKTSILFDLRQRDDQQQIKLDLYIYTSIYIGMRKISSYHKLTKRLLVIFCFMFSHQFGPSSLTAAVPITIGGGSFASHPPAHEGEDVKKMAESLPVYVHSSKANEPIPTNDWWTDLLINRYSGELWAMPFVVSCHEKGFTIYSPKRWNDDGTSMVLEDAVHITVPNCTFQRAVALDWCDWRVVIRLECDDKTWLDLTLVRGMPLIWIEGPNVDIALTSEGVQTSSQGSRNLMFSVAGDKYGVYTSKENVLMSDDFGVQTTGGVPFSKHVPIRSHPRFHPTPLQKL
jgi:endoglucanase Acf2